LSIEIRPPLWTIFVSKHTNQKLIYLSFLSHEYCTVSLISETV